MIDQLIQWLILLATFLGILCIGGAIGDRLANPKRGNNGKRRL